MMPRRSGTRGFKRTSALLQERIRKASQSRGFPETRLLTRWEEIAGPDMARITRPVDISYARKEFGATLTLLTTGPDAPVVEMQKEQLRARINGVYGYHAISRIRLTQTAPTGFAGGQAQIAAHPAPRAAASPDPAVQAHAREAAAPVADDDLRKALEALGHNILTKSRN